MILTKLFRIYGYIFVRPRRYLFSQMCWNSELRVLLTKDDYFGWRFPNIHWWILYKTVFKFCKWLNWDAWRPVCRLEKKIFEHRLIISRIIQRIGAISGFECYHCGSPRGCQVELSDPDCENGKYFKLEKTWEVFTGEYTDYRFSGTTTCPRCGYQQYYEDGSA